MGHELSEQEGVGRRRYNTKPSCTELKGVGKGIVHLHDTVDEIT